MTTARAAAAIALSLLLLASCGGKAPREEAPAPTGPSVFADGAVARSLELSYEGLAADRVERLEAYQGHEFLRAALESKLRGAGHLASSGDLEVAVELVSFRLRSSASAFWLGAMAGSDNVVAVVTVKRGGAEIKRFQTNTSTILGGIAFASGKTRIQRLMSSLSERIVAGL